MPTLNGSEKHMASSHRSGASIPTASLSSLEVSALFAIEGGVVITDPGQPDNPIIYANAGFTHLTGFSNEEVLGQNCRFLQGPGTDPAAVEEIRDAIHAQRPCCVTLLNYRKDGTPFWNQVALSLIRSDSNPHESEHQPVYFVGIQTDVSERVREFEERRANDRIAIERAVHVAAVFASMSDAFFTVDPNWMITYVNARAEVLMVHPATELIGRNLWAIFPEAIGTRFWVEYHRAMRDEMEISFEEYYPPLSSWLAVRVFPYPHGLSIFFRDVTETKRLSRERDEERLAAVARERFLLKEVVFSVTEGKLHICDSAEELPAHCAALQPPIALIDSTTMAQVRREVREAAQVGAFEMERSYDLMSAASEAAMNALQHGATCAFAQVSVCDPEVSKLQVWISDRGPGILFDDLPRAMLMKGHSGAGTLGHGFFLMLQCCDQIWLLTNPSGTTVVLEQNRIQPEPTWITGTA